MSSASLAYAQHMNSLQAAFEMRMSSVPLSCYKLQAYKSGGRSTLQHYCRKRPTINMQTRKGHRLLMAEEKGRRFEHRPHPKLMIHLFIYLQIYFNHQMMYLTHLLMFLRHLLMMNYMFLSNQGPHLYLAKSPVNHRCHHMHLLISPPPPAWPITRGRRRRKGPRKTPATSSSQRKS